MRLQDLNWMDVERYLERDNRIILVAGSTEQHAYLSVMTDVLIPAKIAEAVAKREGVLVAPPLNFGVHSLFGEFPGTISLSKQTFDAVFVEIVEMLLHQGFQHFLVINGHEANKTPDALHELAMNGVIRLIWYDWWRGNAAKTFSERYHLPIEHANWSENFPFTRVAPTPRHEKLLVNTDYLKEQVNIRQIVEDGSLGGLYQVEDALMYILFDAVTAEATLLVKSLLADA